MELFNKILSLVTKSQNIKDKNDDWVIIGVVDNAEAQLIEKKTGLNVAGFSRMIDVSAIRHAKKRHPNLEDTDFCLIPLIVLEAVLICSIGICIRFSSRFFLFCDEE